jgi:hypothetical protein
LAVFCMYLLARGEKGGKYRGIYRDIWLYLAIFTDICTYLAAFTDIYRGISLNRPSLLQGI